MKHRILSMICGWSGLFATLTGCADELDPPSRISELRLLAVAADQPFAEAGQTINLTALAFDPDQRPLSWAWGSCIDASSSLALDCLRALSFDSLTIGPELTTHQLQVPATNAPAVGVAIVVCPGSIVAGNTEGIPLACIDDRGAQLSISQFEVGLKRIYNRDSSLNLNPQIAAVSWDGLPWAEGELKQDSCLRLKDGVCQEFTKHALTLEAPDAAEPSVDASGRAITEQAIVSFFATSGTFDDDVRYYDDAHTKWQARKQDGGQLVTLWFVLRDDRGGVSWTARQVQTP